MQTPYGEVEDLVVAAAPALVRLPGPGTPVFLALFAGKRGRVAILTPERRVVHRPAAEVRDALCREVEGPRAGEVEQLLAEAGLRGRRRLRCARALLRQLLVNKRVGGCWLLRPAGAAGLGSQARETRLPAPALHPSLRSRRQLRPVGPLVVVAGVTVAHTVGWPPVGWRPGCSCW